MTGLEVAPATEGSGAGPTEVFAVRVAGGTWRDDLRAVRVVWKRELIRFGRSRVRILTSLAQPILFLFVLGTGLSPIVRTGPRSPVDFRTFMFPGVIAMTVLFTAIFSAVSIVWDREFGFLREMLVAPVRRGAVVVGKCAGGASVATLQGAIMLALAGLVHVPYSPVMLLVLVAEMAVTAFVLTSLGILVASRMQQVESFQVVMQLFVLPMFFLSGAVFPLRNLPAWLGALTKVDPLSYAVDPMRRVVFSHVALSPAAARALNPGMSWGGWRLPTLLELGMVAVISVVVLSIAVWQFSRPE
ncbi:MAG: ABC transporter permease [Acidimicrobiales bacterium]